VFACVVLGEVCGQVVAMRLVGVDLELETKKETKSF